MVSEHAGIYVWEHRTHPHRRRVTVHCSENSIGILEPFSSVFKQRFIDYVPIRCPKDRLSEHQMGSRLCYALPSRGYAPERLPQQRYRTQDKDDPLLDGGHRAAPTPT